MTNTAKRLDADAWLRRLEQDFGIGPDSAEILGQFVDLPVVGLQAQITPAQPYDRKILTFRGDFEVRLRRECVVSLEAFEETVTGQFERSYNLTPSAPPVPETAEEAEDFPYEGVSLIDMLGDELALNISAFPRKPGAAAPAFAAPEETQEAPRPNPFAVLQGLKV